MVMGRIDGVERGGQVLRAAPRPVTVDRDWRVAFVEQALAQRRAVSRPRQPAALTAAVAPAVSKGRISNATPPASPRPVKVSVPDKQERLRDAVHEAAHAVVAVLCGAQVAHAEIYPVGTEGQPAGSGGQCQLATWNPVLAQQEALIAAAGPVAEAVMLHGPRPSSTQIDARLTYGAGSDGARIRRLEPEVGWSMSPTSEVLPLVLRCWPAICALAVRIDRGRETGHRHVVAALGLSTNDYTRHPFELNAIRAGLRAVPRPKG